MPDVTTVSGEGANALLPHGSAAFGTAQRHRLILAIAAFCHCRTSFRGRLTFACFSVCNFHQTLRNPGEREAIIYVDIVEGALGHRRHSASLGCCTIAMPPRLFTSYSPAVPSLRLPVKITPMAPSAYCHARERKSTSIDGLDQFSRGPRVSRIRSCSTIMWQLGGAT